MCPSVSKLDTVVMLGVMIKETEKGIAQLDLYLAFGDTCILVDVAVIYCLREFGFLPW